MRVEEDLVKGGVPFESAEESLVRKLAFDRRRSSLKKVMMGSAIAKRASETSSERHSARVTDLPVEDYLVMFLVSFLFNARLLFQFLLSGGTV